MRLILLPVILTLVGLGLGAGAGWMLKPKTDAMKEASKEPEKGEQTDTDAAKKPAKEKTPPDEPENSSSEFVKLNNQFVVPVVSDSVVSSLVVMSLSLEVETGLREAVFQREPKLRDALLQVMFDHANIGGFDGTFTTAGNLDVLRAGLTDAARKIVPGDVFGILIVDIARQDL